MSPLSKKTKNQKTLDTIPVPGVKVSANERPLFCHTTIYWSLIGGFIDTHISQPKIKIMTQNFQDKILGVLGVTSNVPSLT